MAGVPKDPLDVWGPRVFFTVVAGVVVGVAALFAFDRIEAARNDNYTDEDVAKDAMGYLLDGDKEGLVDFAASRDRFTYRLPDTMASLRGCSLDGATYTSGFDHLLQGWADWSIEVRFAEPCGGTLDSRLTRCYVPIGWIDDAGPYLPVANIACE